MQRIGCVLHVSSSKNMILKAENIPNIENKVVDKDLNQVGTVFDVFGPVTSPYVAVRPSVEDPKRFVDQPLYAVPLSKPRKERRRKR